jgi:phage-related protein
MTHVSASNDIETVEIKGRDGVLLVDNQRLKPVEQAFNFVVKPKDKTVAQTASDISQWLSTKGFKWFEKSWDSEYLYRASYLNGLDVEEVVRQFGRVQLSFLMHPVKYLKSEQVEKTITSGQTIVNTGNVIANPIIKLTGTGDTTLTINGRQTQLKGIQGNLTWDAERKLVYKDDFTSQWNTVVANQGQYNKPYLDVGNNVISWTGTFTVKIIQNGGVRI